MKIKFIVQYIKKRSLDLLNIISRVVCNITTLSCNLAMKLIYGGLVQKNFSMFMLLKILLDNPCTCISWREKMSSGNWFLRIKKFFFEFSFCLQLNILHSNHLENSDRGNLRFNFTPQSCQIWSEKCEVLWIYIKNIYKNQGFFSLPPCSVHPCIQIKMI